MRSRRHRWCRGIVLLGEASGRINYLKDTPAGGILLPAPPSFLLPDLSCFAAMSSPGATFHSDPESGHTVKPAQNSSSYHTSRNLKRPLCIFLHVLLVVVYLVPSIYYTTRPKFVQPPPTCTVTDTKMNAYYRFLAERGATNAAAQLLSMVSSSDRLLPLRCS